MDYYEIYFTDNNGFTLSQAISGAIHWVKEQEKSYDFKPENFNYAIITNDVEDRLHPEVECKGLIRFFYWDDEIKEILND